MSVRFIFSKYCGPEVDNQYGTDYLGDHEESVITVRGTNGEMVIPYNDTVSVGVVNSTRIVDIDDGECQLWASGVLWLTKEFNSVSLIHEWATRGITINTSVEWGIAEGTSTFVDNIEYMHDVTFTGLCVLNSRATNLQPVIKDRRAHV